jgi:hypothetical protein
VISVIVPYWDRPAALEHMFDNWREVYGLAGLGTVEFVIADDGNAVPPVVPEDLHVLVVTLPRKDRPLNPCVPINAAVRASSGDVLVLTNAEVGHVQPVIDEMLALLEHPDDYVTAPCFDAKRGWLAGPKVDYRGGGRLPVPAGAHFHFLAMLRRSLWDKAGGFDEDYRLGQATDDNDWTWRLHRAGARFRCAEHAVYHLHLGAPVQWGLPHNRDLFRRKWPEVS